MYLNKKQQIPRLVQNSMTHAVIQGITTFLAHTKSFAPLFLQMKDMWYIPDLTTSKCAGTTLPTSLVS
jgi:hypothetical protein